MITQQAASTAANGIDPHAAWLATNTVLCLRMEARITVAGCRDNQHQSKFDNRCTGCRGLFDQVEAIAATPLPFAFLGEPEKLQPASEESGAWIDSENHNPFDLDEDELDELLAEYFPDDDADQDEEREPVYIEDPAAPHDRRVPVYIGRCIRCDGYMTNALERYDGIKDDAVYRCLCCGWRTSPGYAENRAIHHKGL